LAFGKMAKGFVKAKAGLWREESRQAWFTRQRKALGRKKLRTEEQGGLGSV
jgi:hypothetical protein